MRSNFLTAVEQGELPLARRTKKAIVPPELIVRQKTLCDAIALCKQMSGLQEKEIYLALDIDPSHWTRIMKGDAHFPTDKLNQFMDLCGNETPLMWLAHSRGYGLVVLKSESERRAEEAEKALAEEREKTRMLTEILKGK